MCQEPENHTMARNPGKRTLLERGLCLAVLLALSLTTQAWGQIVNEVGKPSAAEDAAENVFLPADRHTLQKLADAKKLLLDGRYGEAVRCLGTILEGPEDFFFQPDKKSPIHRSLKAEAQRLVGQMPRQGRELYELQYGARARRLLADALESGDLTALAEVSRRFFHTQSGYQATYLLGLNHFDRGRPLAGALTLQRLREPGVNAEELEPGLSLTLAACWLQAGMREKAQEVLVSLRQHQPALRVAVAGREVAIFSNDAEAINWLTGLIGATATAGPVEADRWLMFRGNPARNAISIGSAPLMNMRWRVPVTDDPLMETFLDQFQRQSMEQGTPLIPTLHPLAVADVLLMRTAKNLVAVDFSTGKRLWEVPEEEAVETAPGVPSMDMQTRQSLMISGTGQRMWGNLTYGTLSSDGRLVFSIEDLDIASTAGGVSVLRIGGGIRVGGVVNGEQTALCNRLAAYDIRTGKLKWHIGGRAGQYALRQPDTYFLGAPLPLQGQLYVLAEIKGEIRLITLDSASGNLLWSQQLAVVEQSLSQDALRRGAGVSPSYTDGILVCPTSTGAIVGVELASRSLLWGYRYGQGRSNNRSNMMMGIPAFAGGSLLQRWADGNVLIVDGRVLATPAESDFLYCLSLIDGKELWKSPRQNDLYVACADRNRVVLVGRRAVHALRMTDGKPAWNGRSIELPDNSMPSGRGFVAGDRYYLPLSNAEVAGIDINEGKIAHIAKSRKGDIPGNLICYQGKVISQGAESVDAFYQLDAVAADVKRRLAANPNDAEALSLQGETLLDAGNRAEAVASFRRAYELTPAPRTRELLRDALVEGLRTEFAAYRNHVGELEQLADNTDQRADYIRLMAGGLRQTGELAPAFDYYQKLMDLEPDRLPFDRIDQTLSVRRDRWFQSQLAMLRSEAKDDAAAKIDAAVKTHLNAALAAGSIDALERFLDYFGNQPSADSARSELARKLRSAGRMLEAELIQNSEAAAGEQPRNGDNARRPRKDQEASWPVGKAEITVTPSTNVSANGYRRYSIDMRGDAKPYFSDTALHFDDARHMIFGSDGWGRQQWQVSLAADEQRQNFAYNRAWTHARAEGHLLLVMLGWKIMAIDTLGQGHNGTARLLWTQDLLGPGTDQTGLRFPLFGGILPWQLQNQMAQLNDRSSLIGPITNRYVCFQRFRNLIAVDPASGSPLWIRQNVTPGSDLFGDDQYLFVVSPDREDALLLRTSDGEQLGTRKVPRVSGRQVLPSGEEKTVFAHLEDSCLTTIGRHLLLWWQEGTGRTLTLVDPLEGRDLWPGRKFSHAARACVVRDEAVGVFEPDGRFVLVGLSDGRTIADVKLKAESRLIDISIEADDSRYFLIVRSSTSDRNAVNIQPLIGSDPKPINYGRLYAFDKEGKTLWPEPVVIENQFLLSDQPLRLPILTFACQAYVQTANGQGRQKMSVRCIDKRNGRTAFKAEYANQNNIFDITGNPEKKAVDLILQRQTIRLTFTDKPLPPPSSSDGEIAKKPQDSKNTGDFWNSVQKAFGGLLGDAEQKAKQKEKQ